MFTKQVHQGKIGCSKSVTSGLYLIKAEEDINNNNYESARVVLSKEELEKFIEELQELLE